MTGQGDDHDEPIGTGGVLQNWSDKSGEEQGADIGEEEDPIETGDQLEQWPQEEAPIDTEPMPETRGPWNRGEKG